MYEILREVGGQVRAGKQQGKQTTKHRNSHFQNDQDFDAAYRNDRRLPRGHRTGSENRGHALRGACIAIASAPIDRRDAGYECVPATLPINSRDFAGSLKTGTRWYAARYARNPPFLKAYRFPAFRRNRQRHNAAAPEQNTPISRS